MGINFGDMPSSTPASAPIQEVATETGAVTLDLSKGVTLDLTKRNPSLRRIILAAGWDIANTGADFDLDISAFVLNKNGKISSAGSVVFFNNKHIDGITLNNDSRTGEGDGDDETMNIDLAELSPEADSIVVAVSIHDAVAKRQTFGMVNNSYVRLLNQDDNNKEICRFRLKEDAATATSVIFAKLKRNGSDWDFETIGEGKQADLNGLANLYS